MRKTTSLIVIGAGGHACVVADAAQMAGWSIAGHIAPKQGDDPLLGPWLGPDNQMGDAMGDVADCAIGLGFVNAQGAQRRRVLIDSLPSAKMARVLHPSCIVSQSATLSHGVFVAAGAIVGTSAHLGEGALINTGAIVEHHCRVGANTHIATGARLTGSVNVGRDVLIGAGAVVRQGLTIADGAIIGAGALVLTDVPAGAVWAGTPAHMIKPSTQ